jgi:hypothetical protein
VRRISQCPNQIVLCYRLFNLIEYLADHSELIEPNFRILKTTLNNPLFSRKQDRRDNFILQVILAHAQNNLESNKAFFSENTREFGNADIQQVFRSLKINYFSQISNLENYLNAIFQ